MPSVTFKEFTSVINVVFVNTKHPNPCFSYNNDEYLVLITLSNYRLHLAQINVEICFSCTGKLLAVYDQRKVEAATSG